MTTEAPDTQPQDVKTFFHLSRFASYDYLLALLAALIAIVLYLRTLAPGLLAGDSAEFQMAAWLGGFAHSTGYPLYLLLGAIWTHLVPVGDPAWRMNLFSALWGGVAVGLTYLLAFRMVALTVKPDESTLAPVAQPGWATRSAPGSPGVERPAAARGLGTAAPLAGSRMRERLLRGAPRSHVSSRQAAWGAARLAAFFAALVFATTPTFWSQAVVTEVYTLNMVFLVAVLLGLTTWATQLPHERSGRPLYWTAAIYGLSLTHHRSMLLLAPAMAAYVWLETRRSQSPASFAGQSPASFAGQSPAPSTGEGWHVRSGSLLRVSALVLLPLLLYLYIPIRAPHTPYAEVRVGPEQTLELYRPTVDGFLAHVSGQVFGNALGTSADTLNRLASVAKLFVAEVTWVGLALGLAGVVWLARRSRPLLVLTALSFVAVCIFNFFYGIGDIFVFYIPAYFIWVLWMALGVFGLGIWLVELLRSPALSAAANGWPRTQTIALLLPAAVGLALPVWSVMQHYERLDQSHNNQARAAWQTILAEPIPQGAILLSNDRDEMVPLWYLQYVEGVRPDLTGLFPLIQPTPEWADIAQVVNTALRSGRPVALIKPMPGLETKFQLEPSGLLVRVLGPAVAGPPQRPQAIDFGGAVRLTGYDLEPPTPSPWLRPGFDRGDVVKVTLYWQPLRQLQADYTTFVHLINADGQVIGQSDHRPGGAYFPSSLWRSGDTIVDAHTITLTDPGRAPYAIEAGLYTGVSTLEHLGQPERIGLVGQ